MGLSSEWIKILVCPDCKGNLADSKASLVCESCGNSFEIIDGIPLLISGCGGAEKDHYARQKEYFDREFKEYGHYSLENWRKSYLDRIFGGLGFENANLSNHFYLDIGCGGSGYTVIEASRRGIRSVGCDLSLEGMLKAQSFAREEGVGNCTFFVVCSAERLPFKREIFSGISSIAVLEHLPHDDQAIKEIFRTAKANARVFVTVPNAYKRIWPLLWLPYYIHDKRIGHLRHYTEENLTKKFEQAGFELLEVYYSGHMVKICQKLLSILPLKGHQRDHLWWRLEKRDLAKKRVSTGLNISAIFAKA